MEEKFPHHQPASDGKLDLLRIFVEANAQSSMNRLTRKDRENEWLESAFKATLKVSDHDSNVLAYFSGVAYSEKQWYSRSLGDNLMNEAIANNGRENVLNSDSLRAIQSSAADGKVPLWLEQQVALGAGSKLAPEVQKYVLAAVFRQKNLGSQGKNLGAASGSSKATDRHIDNIDVHVGMSKPSQKRLLNLPEKPTTPKMLGHNGVRTASTTVWKGKGKERIDVENPNPGQRPGQVHYQDNDNNKYLYDPATNSFQGAPKKVNDLLKDPKFTDAIRKAMKQYLGE